MQDSVCLAGVGMTPFFKPSAGEKYEELIPRAALNALYDSGLAYKQVDQVIASYVLGDSCSGQKGIYRLGRTGVPVVNVNNGCASGSTAIYLARQAILAGHAQCVLVVGFEQMATTRLALGYSDRTSPVGDWDDAVRAWGGDGHDTTTVGWFAAAAREYQEKYQVADLTFAQIAAKARTHGSRNPCAVFREVVTPEQVLQSGVICPPLTRFECSAPTSGAAAVVLCSLDFARSAGIRHDVSIVAQALVTDNDATFSGSMIDLMGAPMTRAASEKVYELASIGPEDVDVVELHDCFASNELIAYEALGLARDGEGSKLSTDGDNTYGGKWVVNPSGGLLSKGHPIGATGVAQCVELVRQLRGEAEERQVGGASIGLQHNLGIGGACVVGLFQRSARPAR